MSKVFCWYNPEFREIWWHIPRQTDTEPVGIIRFNIDELTWTPDYIVNRTAAEYPSVISETPYLINSSGVIYKHEDGTDADGLPLYWNVNTNRIFNGTNAMNLDAFIPNYTLQGAMGVIVKTFDYPNSTAKNARQFVVNNETERMPVEMQGRYWQYLLAGFELGQSMKLGKWLEEVSGGSRR